MERMSESKIQKLLYQDKQTRRIYHRLVTRRWHTFNAVDKTRPMIIFYFMYKVLGEIFRSKKEGGTDDMPHCQGNYEGLEI
jgi:hypothetical protein